MRERRRARGHQRDRHAAVHRHHDHFAVLETPHDIIELLRGDYDAIDELLLRMAAKLKSGLKVLWAGDEAVRRIGA